MLKIITEDISGAVNVKPRLLSSIDQSDGYGNLNPSSGLSYDLAKVCAIIGYTTIVDNTAYLVGYVVDGRYIDDYIPILTTMLNSFELAESASSANQQQPLQQDGGGGFDYSRDIALLREEVFSQIPRDESGTGFDSSPQEQGEEFNPFGQGGGQ